MFKQFNGNLRYHRSCVTRLVFILIFVLLGCNVCCDQNQNDNTSIKVYDDMNEALEDLFELYSEYVNNPIEGPGNIVYFYNHYGNQNQKRINTIAAKMSKQSLPRISIDINKKDKYEPLRFANDDAYYRQNGIGINQHNPGFLPIANNIGFVEIGLVNQNNVFDYLLDRRRLHARNLNNKEYYIHTEEAIASLLHMHFQQQNNQQIQQQDNDAQRIVVFVSKNTMCPRCQRILSVVANQYNLKFIVLCLEKFRDNEDLNGFKKYVIRCQINDKIRTLYSSIHYLYNCVLKQKQNHFILQRNSCSIDCNILHNVWCCPYEQNIDRQILKVTSKKSVSDVQCCPILIHTNCSEDEIQQINTVLRNRVLLWRQNNIVLNNQDYDKLRTVSIILNDTSYHNS